MHATAQDATEQGPNGFEVERYDGLHAAPPRGAGRCVSVLDLDYVEPHPTDASVKQPAPAGHKPFSTQADVDAENRQEVRARVALPRHQKLMRQRVYQRVRQSSLLFQTVQHHR